MDSTMVNKINFSLNLLKQTPFYRKMVDILESNNFKDQIQRLKNMQENGRIEMVIYEIGSMENSEESCLQFALALLLKNESHLNIAEWWSFHFGSAAIDPHQIALRHVCYNLTWHFFKMSSDEEQPYHLVRWKKKVQSARRALQINKKIQISNPIVLYGVGKIEDSEKSRLQLSLAILLKRDFEWVEELAVCEPNANPTEIKVMQGFGCNWISNNEKGPTFVRKPTLFFMPWVPLYVHNHLYSANWGSDGLNKMIVLGNSFKTTTSLVPQITYIFQVLHRDGIVCELPVSGQGSGPLDDCSYAFRFHSWHFFNSSANSSDQDKISVSGVLL